MPTPAFPADREPSRRRPPRCRPEGAPTATDRPPSDRPLRLDVVAVSGLKGLEAETAFLRAAARRLAAGEATDDEVKRLAELRHQVEALGRTLKTQRGLDGGEADALSATLARVLEQLGDEMGVPR